jgi:TetR/AcrR family transcriptional regulator, regulator of cefoperazone and chloramphenicol sensitivity
MLSMCSARAGDRRDLTARAVIRDEALRLFAVHGPEAVSLRRVAAEAGVSPALVAHHFGSKAGLRQAVDAHVAALFDALFDTLFTALHEADWDSPAMAGSLAGSLAEAMLRQLPPDSPVPAYLRRLLMSADTTGRALFARWFSLTEQVLDRLTAAGVVRASPDPSVRAAFLMINDLAALLLRDHVTAVLGVDPLSPDGAMRWTQTVLAVYGTGIFATPTDTSKESP